MNKLTIEIKKLIEGYKGTILKNNSIEKSFEILSKDFPDLISIKNEKEVKEYLKSIK